MTELTPADVLADLFEHEGVIFPSAAVASRAAELILQRLTDAGFEVRSAWPLSDPAAVLEHVEKVRATAIEECATAALEQRCERGTPWDLACVTIAEKIRALGGSHE